MVHFVIWFERNFTDKLDEKKLDIMDSCHVPVLPCRNKNIQIGIPKIMAQTILLEEDMIVIHAMQMGTFLLNALEVYLGYTHFDE